MNVPECKDESCIDVAYDMIEKDMKEENRKIFLDQSAVDWYEQESENKQFGRNARGG